MRVLMIEDDPAIAEMLLLVLQLEGFSVDVAANGERGLELAQHAEPDVIILDVIRPHVDGWWIAAALKQDPDLASVPIMFCAADTDEESTWRGWQLGAASYVTKPFDIEELISELIRVTRPTSMAAGESPRSLRSA